MLNGVWRLRRLRGAAVVAKQQLSFWATYGPGPQQIAVMWLTLPAHVVCSHVPYPGSPASAQCSISCAQRVSCTMAERN